MSDTRFDGKRIYKFMSGSRHAVFDIRGKYLHKAGSSGPPEYEIRGDFIYRAGGASRPEFGICGDKIRKAFIRSRMTYSRDRAIYEIR